MAAPLIRCSHLPLLATPEGEAKLWNIYKLGIEEPPSNPLAVAIGLALEPFHREWFTKQTGYTVLDDPGAGTIRLSDERVGITTSGFDGFGSFEDGTPFVFEGKILHGNAPLSVSAQHYWPQMVGYSILSGIRNIAFSVIGRAEATWHWKALTVQQSDIDALVERVATFRRMLEADIAPWDMPETPETTQQRKRLRIDLTQFGVFPATVLHNTPFEGLAREWRATRATAKRHEQVQALLAKLMPPEARILHSPLVVMRRTASNAIQVFPREETPATILQEIEQ